MLTTTAPTLAATPKIPLRILAVADLWQGSDGYAYIRALRRLGHSVRVVPSEHFVPADWESLPFRALRRILSPLLVREYTHALIKAAQEMQPHLFFVFKGRYVSAQAVQAIREMGVTAINFYPDVSFLAHGSYLPQALPLYDWIFQTKTFGIHDLMHQLKVQHTSFLQPSFDPEVHYPVTLTALEQTQLAADVCFIGTWSPNKQHWVEAIAQRLPQVKLRVWGSQWEGRSPWLTNCVEGRHILGLEYTKAIAASKINLGLLSEIRKGASSGDLITARTFQIPGTGAFMLHQRTSELALYFTEAQECACFSEVDELIAQITHYLEHPAERQRIAANGHRRALESGYGVEYQAAQIVAKTLELRGQ